MRTDTWLPNLFVKENSLKGPRFLFCYSRQIFITLASVIAVRNCSRVYSHMNATKKFEQSLFFIVTGSQRLCKRVPAFSFLMLFLRNGILMIKARMTLFFNTVFFQLALFYSLQTCLPNFPPMTLASTLH